MALSIGRGCVRVLFLQRQPCVRALKYAVALRAASPGIALSFAHQGTTLTGWYGSGDDVFDRWWRLPVSDPAPALAEAVAAFAPDLIHSHNLPDELTVTALGVAGGRIPVIHDCHDLQSLRRTPYEDRLGPAPRPVADERDAIEGCAALIVVSEEMLEAIRARHRPPARTLVFANYALERDVAPPRPPARERAGPPRLVYQGSLSVNGSHYDLREQFAAAGVPIDVYPNRDAPEYRSLAARTPGLRLRARLEPAELMQRLPGYDAGWAVFNSRLNGPHLDTALPNKAFEYLASGLPIVAGPHRALRRLVADEGLGVVVERAGDVLAALAAADLPALRARVGERRGGFTVEDRIGALLDLYRDVTAGALAA